MVTPVRAIVVLNHVLGAELKRAQKELDIAIAKNKEKEIVRLTKSRVRLQKAGESLGALQLGDIENDEEIT